MRSGCSSKRPKAPWSANALAMVVDQSISTTVVGLQNLRESRVDWSRFAATGDIERPEPKTLREDQIEALESVTGKLKAADRGKLIMACGTGKTLTSLRIAEELAGEGGYVLLLVPSLALMAQSVPEWCADALVPITAYAVCSDSQVGKRRRTAEDVAEIEVTDLAFPATTKADKLAAAVEASDGGSMRVIFATYQSISVIERAQAEHGLPEFDLIICDEAHRTTGVTFAGEDESNFVNIESTIAFYNAELERWSIEKRAVESAGGPEKEIPMVDGFVTVNRARISWSDNVKRDLVRGKALELSEGGLMPCVYRPFTKQWLFYSRRLNDRVYQMPRIFPDSESPNRVIAASGTGARSEFSALMLDTLPSLDTIEKGQCFPFWLYEAAPDAEPDMLSELDGGPVVQRREAITEHALGLFAAAYPTETIGREDIFHYIYGLLHSEDYRQRYRANLAKDLPRIPCVASVEDYRAFRDAGQRLGELHVGYESVDRYPAEIDTGGASLDNMALEVAYRVTKMKHPGTGRNKDRTAVVYNRHITVRGIPEEAWDYVLNGKPALKWVMERQCVKTDKASGIVSDAKPVRRRDRGRPAVPARPAAAGHHGEPGNHEDRPGVAGGFGGLTRAAGDSLAGATRTRSRRCPRHA